MTSMTRVVGITIKIKGLEGTAIVTPAIASRWIDVGDDVRG